MACVNIMESVEHLGPIENYLSVSERYYTTKYCVNFSCKDNEADHCVSFHSNRICLISLAEKHPIIKCKKQIVKVDCVVNNVNRRHSKSSGKGKHGAQKLNPNSIICYLSCDDDTSYPVYSCIKGKLLEVNDNIFTNPQLIIEKPRSDGYIALLLPYLNTFNSFKDSLLTEKEYLNEK